MKALVSLITTAEAESLIFKTGGLVTEPFFLLHPRIFHMPLVGIKIFADGSVNKLICTFSRKLSVFTLAVNELAMYTIQFTFHVRVRKFEIYIQKYRHVSLHSKSNMVISTFFCLSCKHFFLFSLEADFIAKEILVN